MRKIIFLKIALLLNFSCLVFAENASIQIDLTRQIKGRVKVVIDEFQNFPDRKKDRRLASGGRKTIINDLALTEMFEVLPSPARKNKDFLEPDRIDYTFWSNTGAQWVVRTQYWTDSKTGSTLFVFRLFDAVNKRFVVGKRYKAHRMLTHRMMHRFADEMVEQLTGKRGVADTKIAYIVEDKGDKEIYLIDFDGNNRQKLTSDHSIALRPTWSPDGSRIVFTSYSKNNNNPNLVMMNINKKQRWSVLTLPGLNTAPAWSPDGGKIALVLSRDKNSEIYYLTRKRKLRRLTSHFNIDTSPAWSPDGKKIAFTSDRSGIASPQIYIMDSVLGDKGHAKRITFDSSYNDNPSWSPDGEKIAYTSKVDSSFQIKIYNLKTRRAEVLTKGRGSREEPSWSPDGRFIIYRKRIVGGYALFIKKLGGGLPRRLTAGHHPAWSPYLR